MTNIIELATRQNRMNTALGFIEAADEGQLLDLADAIKDRLSELDGIGLTDAIDSLASAVDALAAYERDPRHENGCGCRDCTEARLEAARDRYSDNRDRA